MKHTDEWIENRLIRKAKKHGVPTDCTQFYSDLDPAIQKAVSTLTQDSDLGTPVVLAYESADKWTLIGTRQTAGWLDGRFRSFDHAKITSIRSRDYPPSPRDVSETLSFQRMGQLKTSWEILVLTDSAGREELFWVPAGSQAFAVWNIILTAYRLLA
jgi:hypothetical protein